MSRAYERRDFDYIRECGSVERNYARPIPGVLLIGGAEGDASGEDPATRWFLERIDRGNYLVLRSGGVGSQAGWICDYYRDFIGSSAELSIDSREGAEDPDVIAYIRDCLLYTSPSPRDA